MAKKWVLHTETKGTGAQVVPLERVTKSSGATEPVFVARQPPRRAAREAKLKTPRRFKVVDVMTRQPLIEGGARATVEALKQTRSTVDVNLYVWQEEDERWRLLSLAEQRAMWDLAHG